MQSHYKNALIVGAGAGLSASLARLFAAEGIGVALAARETGKLSALAAKIKAGVFACDAADPRAVEALFAAATAHFGVAPDVVVYNPSARLRGPILDLDPEAVAKALAITAYGGFLVAQAAAKTMVPARHGAILFSGASASVKGYPGSAPFAMGKFALRGLAQSLARELLPQGIHIGHVIIDGGIRSDRRPEPADAPDSLLDPDAIARSYLHLLRQDRSAWTWEIELRPFVEKF